MRCSLTIALVTLTLAIISLAGSTRSPYNVHEMRSAIPTGWTRTRRHENGATLPLRIALKQSNIESIGDFLYDVSHPESANYGKHWTAEEISRKFSPSDGTVSTVRDWLIENGLARERIRVSPTKGWINVNVTVEEAERLMNTEYHVYTHDSGKEHVG